jgi:predicted KAP-like P-loop ATPase
MSQPAEPLVLHHLKETGSEQITIINFACWWFRGEEQLALAFFRELYAGLGVPLGERFKNLLPKIGARLLRAGAVVGPAIDLAGAAGAGTLASGAMGWLSGLIQQEDTVEKLHGELSKTLGDQTKRFLMVIDDIDRLAPDEALLIFRLVKSVGRLPNVIYLLVFDRLLAEAIVHEKYPAEGAHYLEKIVQAGFDIPEPRQHDLREQLLVEIAEICGAADADISTRFMNVFYDVVVPEIRMPRDLIRLANCLAVTWPAVGHEVDRADFVGLEVLRVFRPNLYRAIRANKVRLTTTTAPTSRWTQVEQDQFDKNLLSSVPEAERERLRRALTRLFPPLESVWDNVIYGHDSGDEWSRERRVCSSDHFDSYFRFSISDEVLAKQEVDDLIAHASDDALIVAALREGLGVKRSSGGTKAALILEELNRHADKVADDHIQPLLASIFRLGDELDVEDDVVKGFSIGDNRLRIHWLLRRLTRERFDLLRRSSILRAACEAAALGWLVEFAASAYSDYHPRPGKAPQQESLCLTTSADAAALHRMALTRIRQAAQTGELSAHARLAYLLYRGHDLAEDNGAEVRQWSDDQLARDEAVVKFARAFTSRGWSTTDRDVVAERTTLANVEHLETVLDKVRFRARVEELAERDGLSPEEAGIIKEFLAAWRDHGQNKR